MTADTPPGAGRLPAPPYLPPPQVSPHPAPGPPPADAHPWPSPGPACRASTWPVRTQLPPPGSKTARRARRGREEPPAGHVAPTYEGDARKTRTALRPNCRFDNIGKPRPIFM